MDNTPFLCHHYFHYYYYYWPFLFGILASSIVFKSFTFFFNLNIFFLIKIAIGCVKQAAKRNFTR